MAASEGVREPVTRLVASAGLEGCVACAELAHPLSTADARIEAPPRPIDAMAEETALVAASQPEVRAMFAAGRSCARRALAALGARPEPLLRAGPAASGADRAPAWPQGFTGSIAHTRTHCAAIAARTRTHRAVGLDLETASRVTPKLLDRICTAPERSALESDPDPGRRALHFAAREAFYKAWSPLTRRAIGFRDVEVLVHDAMRFEVRVRDGLDIAPFERASFGGSWAMAGELIVAVVVVPAD